MNKTYKVGNSTYIYIEMLGKGTYGTVVRAKNILTNEEVAIKKVKLDVEGEGIPATCLREISILKHFKHINVVELLKIDHNDKKVLLYLEYVKYDLKKFWDIEFKGKTVSLDFVKTVMFQILKGMEFLHSKKILHRDLKPQNVLIDSDLKVKIADFGLSRTYSIPIRPYTKEVLTLWYRAPELILGTEYYSTGIDMWSIGCIFAELFLKKPLFQGDSEINQIYYIFRVLSSPNEESLPGYKTFPHYNVNFPYYEVGTGLAKALEGTVANEDAINLMTSMLLLNPAKRISCKEALKHPFFKGVHDPFSKN